MDIEIEFKYINTAANFWKKNEKYEDCRFPFRATQKPYRGEKQEGMVLREPGTNHSTQVLEVEEDENEEDPSTGQYGAPAVDLK